MLLILGAGGCAREVYFYILAMQAANTLPAAEIIFYDDISENESLIIGGKTHRVVSNFEKVREAKFIVGVGNPKLKKELVIKALNAGLNPADTLVYPNVVILDKEGVKLGKGGVIAPNCVLTTNIVIGDYVTLNYSSTVGHDVIMEDFVMINPGAQISGNVTLKEGVMIGAGACVIEKKSIAPWAIIGAKSCVTKDLVNSHATYLGIPAQQKL